MVTLLEGYVRNLTTIYGLKMIRIKTRNVIYIVPKEDLEKYYIKQFELKIKDELKMENLYSTNLTEIQMNDSEKRDTFTFYQ
jgi:molybdate-binding protein